MKTYKNVEVWLHTFLTSALDGAEWWVPRTNRFSHGVSSKSSLDAVVKRRKRNPDCRPVTILTDLLWKEFPQDCTMRPLYCSTTISWNRSVSQSSTFRLVKGWQWVKGHLVYYSAVNILLYNSLSLFHVCILSSAHQWLPLPALAERWSRQQRRWRSIRLQAKRD